MIQKTKRWDPQNIPEKQTNSEMIRAGALGASAVIPSHSWEWEGMALSLSVYSLLIEIMGSSEDANVCSCDGQNHFLLSVNTWMGGKCQLHFNCYEERIRIHADSGV